MEQWKGKVAVVTGASAGIGAAISKDLCAQGVIVAGFARRLDRLEALRAEIVEKKMDAQFVPVQCDITVEEEIKTAFEYVIARLGGVDILVNNAGIIQKTLLLEDNNMEKLMAVLNTNLIALISCTKKAYKSMAERDVPGYIINISSVAGHNVPNHPPLMNVYPSSKYAVTALNTVLRHELNHLKQNKIRVSNISPGAVITEIGGNVVSEMKEPMEIKALLPEDLSSIVLYMLGTDPRVQVEDVIVRAVGN